MKRRGFPALTTRTAAGLTATPVLAGGPDVELALRGGIAPGRVTRTGDFVVSAQSFSERHPDKLADLIADTLIDDSGPKPLATRFGAVSALSPPRISSSLMGR